MGYIYNSSSLGLTDNQSTVKGFDIEQNFDLDLMIEEEE